MIQKYNPVKLHRSQIWYLVSGGSTVVEHSTTHPDIKGLNPAAV